MRVALLAAVALMGAWPVHAADWRAMPHYGRDVAFVDADSVRRKADGTIGFEARFLLGEDNPSGDFGYDRHNLTATARCGQDKAESVRDLQTKRTFLFRGSAASPDNWIVEEAEGAAGGLAGNLCRGLIGYRSFATPEDGLAEYKQSHSVEQLMASVSAEAELTGTVVQGFEMNGVALCGSEAGCTPKAPTEFCWLQGSIHVPVPAGADPNTIRRDSADFAFRGRVLRSPTGRGFGHVRAFGCQVEMTGPARPATIERAEAAARPVSLGTSEAALGAHKALEDAFRGIGAVTAAQDGRSWPMDELKARPSDWQGACGSDLKFKGASLDPYPTAIIWDLVDAIEVRGPVLAIRTSRWREGGEFRMPTPGAALELVTLLDRLRAGGIRSVAQRGNAVTVLQGILTHHGPIFAGKTKLKQQSAADAVMLAGIIDSLSRMDVHSIKQQGNLVTALGARHVGLTFESEAKAEQIAGLLRELVRVCRAPPSA